MRSSFPASLTILVLSLALLVSPLQAQVIYGSIVGTVADASGAVVPGAALILTNNGTGERRNAVTGGDGGYRFVNLVPGNYRLEIEQKGFRHFTQDQITVTVDSQVRVDVAMQVGEVTQSIQVTSEAPLLQTENASLSQVVAARSVQELPLNGRNVLNLVALVPGVVLQGSSEGSLTGKNVFAAGNFQIGGGTANQSASYYDGVPVNVTYGNIVALVPSQDAVSEFRVQTNNNSAEYGRYTGGVVNLASKSGTNEFHGSAYEFLRNKVLNANDFFANKTSAGRAPFVQNQFGVSLGGPVIKDKAFFFGGYEGYRQREGRLFRQTVPTAEWMSGDFSSYLNSSGAQVPVYDPLTQCGAYGNPACGTGTIQRSVFPGNRIPANRINPVSAKLLAFPIFGKPNTPGNQYTQQFNFSKIATVGGDNDQYNLRGDVNVSDKQRVLARYTRWKSVNRAGDPYGTGIVTGDPISPESFTTDQALLADTYSISPTTIFDIRLGFMRWYYDRTPGHLGINISEKFGLPAYYNQIGALSGDAGATAVPRIGITGFDFIGTGRLWGRDNTFVVTPSLIKIMGSHTLKVGADLRRLDLNYFQNNNPGGTFNFTNVFTAQNALTPGASGNPLASFLLGYASSGQAQTSPPTSGSMRYQAYYFTDTWQATRKLTLNLGVRWEMPGVFTERFDRLATFDTTMINPVVKDAGITVGGQPVKGAFVLVNGPGHPERSLRPEKYNLFAPRVGIAYRLSERTVLRTGGGLFFVPSNVQFPEGPCQAPNSYLLFDMVNSIDSMITPADTMSDPYPGGFTSPPGRDPSFQRVLLGGSVNSLLREISYPYASQWNFTIQHQFPMDVAVEAAYAGLSGVHLPFGNKQLNYLPTSVIQSQTSQLKAQVTNPFYGLIKTGTLSTKTVQAGLLQMPFPAYSSAQDRGGYVGNSNYHALQVKAEKRFASGGTLLASYTFSKTISNVETLTSWLETGTAVGGIQNWDDLAPERSLSSFDSRQRLTISYVLDIPVGKGQRFLPDVQGVAGKLISGWGINGTTTFQEGFPLSLSATPNSTGFNTGLRPNVAADCNKFESGRAQDRINKWFNTSCFSVPGIYTFGNEGRVDPNLRGHGINNFDFAAFKRTAITERFNLEFRVEAFNLFNRVRFRNPGTQATTAAVSTFGQVSAQANMPRLVQLALRLRF